MQGQWVESTHIATLYGKATVPVTQFSISPQNPTLNTNNQRVTLTAQGGSGSYLWRVGDSSLGTINSSNGANVVYVRLQSGDNVVYLTDGVNSALTATNSILQPDTDLAISGPASVTVNSTVEYTATGGEGNYTWALGDPTIGSPDQGSGSIFGYTAYSNGTQSIFLRDGNSNVRTQLVSQTGGSTNTVPTP
jgi:hypothetical protein